MRQIVFNSSSETWSNVTTQDAKLFQPETEGYGGVLTHFVPTFGTEGLLFALHSVETEGQVYIYEPVTQKWYVQVVSGELPDMSLGCLVGAEGDTGTYEV